MNLAPDKIKLSFSKKMGNLMALHKRKNNQSN